MKLILLLTILAFGCHCAPIPSKFIGINSLRANNLNQNLPKPESKSSSYSFENVSFQESFQSQGTGDDSEGNYSNLSISEAETNADVKSALDFGIQEIAKKLAIQNQVQKEELKVLKINSIQTKQTSEAIYYRFNLDLSDTANATIKTSFTVQSDSKTGAKALQGFSFNYFKESESTQNGLGTALESELKPLIDSFKPPSQEHHSDILQGALDNVFGDEFDDPFNIDLEPFIEPAIEIPTIPVIDIANNIRKNTKPGKQLSLEEVQKDADAKSALDFGLSQLTESLANKGVITSSELKMTKLTHAEARQEDGGVSYTFDLDLNDKNSNLKITMTIFHDTKTGQNSMTSFGLVSSSEVSKAYVLRR